MEEHPNLVAIKIFEKCALLVHLVELRGFPERLAHGPRHLAEESNLILKLIESWEHVVLQKFTDVPEHLADVFRRHGHVH